MGILDVRWGRRQAVVALTAGAGLLALGGETRAADLPTVGFGCGSTDPIFTVAYVTLSKGFFKDAGLKVNYLDSQSGPRTKQMLAAGQIAVGASGASDPMTVTVAGKPATLILGLDRKITYANVLVHRDNFESGRFKSLKDLSHQSVGVTQPQSATWLMGVYLTEKAGATDLTFRGLGDLSTMLGALKSKQVAATVATMGMMEQGIKQGFAVPIFDVTDDAAWTAAFGGDVPGLGCYVMKDSITRDADALQAFVSAMVLGQDFITASSADAITDLIHDSYLHAFDRDAVLKTITLYKDKVFTKDNLIGQAEYERLLAITGGGRQFSEVELKQIPYSQAVDMRFVRKARNLI